MALLDAMQQMHCDFIDCITARANDAYKLSRSGLLNNDQRQLFSSKAASLREAAEELFDEDFHDDTDSFKKCVNDLATVNTQVQASIDALNDAATRAADVATLLKLFDQALAIAASVAPK